MMKKLSFFLLALATFSLSGCRETTTPDVYNKAASDPKLYNDLGIHLTDIVIHDIFKPPVASRIYAYTNLAGYEALVPGNSEYKSLAGQLNGFTATPQPEEGKEYCFPLASAKAFAVVGKKLTFSEKMWDDYEKDFFQKYKDMGIPNDVIDRSMAYGEAVAKHVIDYSGGDNYKQIRGFRYTVTNAPGTWVPTPPAYADACEPMWNTVRPFTMDSVKQFHCPPPAKYDLGKNSQFIKLTREVYDIGKNMTEDQRTTAYFWDDNAFVTNVVGHVMFANKKMTPPGHWLAITRTVAEDQKLNLMQTTECYTLGSIAMFDAFVSCWQEKYSSVRIRPETVINNGWDPAWRPYLETPPFPEYVSGHSSVSAACGTILTHLMGKNVAFTDTTEKKYGHGVKSFKSFEDAYWDASYSRMYGGIHYRDGVEEGTHLGQTVGNWVWQKLDTRKQGKETIAIR